MLHYPDVYRKAQEEIDRVIGNERLPDLTDRGSLPYLEAVVMELYRCVTSNTCDSFILKMQCRWNPPLPVGMFLGFSVSHILENVDIFLYRDSTRID